MKSRRAQSGLDVSVRRMWEAACQYDKIDPNSPFVIFSDDNPFVAFHTTAVRELQEAMQAYAVFGYVGLRLGSRSKSVGTAKKAGVR